MILERKAGRLVVKAYETRAEMGRAAAAEAAQALRAVLADKGAAGDICRRASQNEFLEALCGADVDWSRVDAFHMDEYIGLPEEAPQGFGNFLKRAIIDRVPFRSVNRIRGGAADVDGGDCPVFPPCCGSSRRMWCSWGSGKTDILPSTIRMWLTSTTIA